MLVARMLRVVMEIPSKLVTPHVYGGMMSKFVHRVVTIVLVTPVCPIANVVTMVTHKFVFLHQLAITGTQVLSAFMVVLLVASAINVLQIANGALAVSLKNVLRVLPAINGPIP